MARLNPKEIVARVVESKEFRNSHVYQRLLTYLVDAMLNNDIPKETTIAIDVFGKTPDFNSNKDATVRSHVHTLRKKLARYYEKENFSDELRIQIPKGRYEVKFVENKPPESDSPQLRRSYHAHIAIGLLLLFILILVQIFKLKGTDFGDLPDLRPFSGNQFWSGFFTNDNPTLIIVGDDFLLDDYRPDLGRYRIVRDWEIDSYSDLERFLAQYPKENLKKSELTAIPYGGMQNIVNLIPAFTAFRRSFGVRMSSELKYDEIKDRNIIYIGEFKNLRILQQMLNKTPLRYQYLPDERLFLLDEKGDTSRVFIRREAPYEQKDKFNIDYSALIRVPGLADENLMFVAGFGYGGRLERTKMIGNPELLQRFVLEASAVNGRFEECFLAVFEVKSIERTGFSSKLVYYQSLPVNLLVNPFDDFDE